MNERYGIVGFFDILGYQNFLEHNKEETSYARVIDKLLSIRDTIPANLKSSIRGATDMGFKIVDEMTWLVFSDTVVLTLPLPKEDKPNELAMRWSAFLLSSIHLWREMFDFGLPIRGAIDCGNYYTKEYCLAGDPIIAAYKLAHDLDLAAIALTQRAFSVSTETANHPEEKKNLSAVLPTQVLQYKAPRKMQNPESIPLLNSLGVLFSTNPEIKPDVTQYVLSRFWAHKKQLDEDGLRKAKNTETHLRFILSMFKGLLWGMCRQLLK